MATTKLWPYEVRFQHQRPMRGTVRATSRTEALAIVRERHPEAAYVEVAGLNRKAQVR